MFHAIIDGREARKTEIFLALMFLTATATFVVGDAKVVASFTGLMDIGQLKLGVALQAIDALAVAALGAGFVRILRPFHPRLAYGHLAARVLECLAILGIGTYMLAEHRLVNYEPVVYLFTGTAGFMFTYVLLRSGLVATWLARLGVIGYLAILAALPVEWLDIASLQTFPGMLLYVPGGLFEILLPAVLLTRGFREVGRLAPTRSTPQVTIR